MSAAPDARAALDDVRARGAWAVIRRKESPTAGVIGGTPREVASLMDIDLEAGVPEHGHSSDGHRADRLVAVPFRQIAERGFEAHDEGTPLIVVDLEAEHEVEVADLLEALPDLPIDFDDRGGFESTDAEYADVVRTIIADEIGRGEGANLVVGRHFRAVVADWSAERALTVFRRLLERERGAYWTFCFFTGERYLVGASPERHVSARGGNVRMNPISGTFRVAERPGASESAPSGDLKRRLLDFLADEKEIYELFMVVDEELKMMCDVCDEGGQVLGPFLKPMTHLVHTEYLLAGRTDRDPREVLRDTMYAATVTGSPVENACRLITRYETRDRGYYGAALALFGRDRDGAATLDSPILIRTADVDVDGQLTVTAGTTLVRDSVAEDEVAETHAKAGGILSAFGLVDAPPASAPGASIADLARDEDVLLALSARNQRLSRFWLDQQGDAAGRTGVDVDLVGKRVLILDHEDDFVNMLRHVLGVLGMTTTVLRHDAVDAATLEASAFDGHDLVLLGPGPGDPREREHPKISVARRAAQVLREAGRPFLAVCLGHQVLCDSLGLPLTYKDIVFQGTQSPVGIDGRTERVGFYNTFVARADDAEAAAAGVVVETDADSGDVHLVRGPHFVGIQFHAESILTQNGPALLRGLIRELLVPDA